MKWFKMITAIFMISVANVGCASASGSNYYEAVQKAAEAKALVSEARYRALAQVASSGDGQAASAAVMAIASFYQLRYKTKGGSSPTATHGSGSNPLTQS